MLEKAYTDDGMWVWQHRSLIAVPRCQARLSVGGIQCERAAAHNNLDPANGGHKDNNPWHLAGVTTLWNYDAEAA